MPYLMTYSIYSEAPWKKKDDNEKTTWKHQGWKEYDSYQDWKNYEKKASGLVSAK